MGSFVSKFGQALDGMLKRYRTNDGETEGGAADAVGAVTSIGTSSKVADWVMALVIICFSYAFQLAVQSLQLDSKTINHPLFHLLSLALLLSFFSLVAAELVKPEFRSLSRFLHRLAVVLLASSFYMAISIPFPLYFKLISLFLFIISFSLFLFRSIRESSRSVSSA